MARNGLKYANVRELLDAHWSSHAEVARELGVNRSTVNRWATGAFLPTNHWRALLRRSVERGADRQQVIELMVKVVQ